MSSLLSRICLLSKNTVHFVKPGRDFFTFLFFLVLSGIFWLFTALNESYDREVSFPVSLEGIPKKVVVTSGVNDTIHVTIRDKGYAIMNYMYGNKVKPIAIDFNTYSRESGYGVVSASELQKLIRQQIYASSTLVSVKPEKLEFTYTMGKPRKVAVRISGNVIPADNYYLANTVITPQMVTIYASEYLLDSVKYVLTEPLNIRNFTDTITKEVSLKPIKGVRMSPSKVTVKFFPDILTEESIEVPIVPVNVPDGVTLRTFPTRMNVKFNIGVSQYRTLNTDMFRIEADYSGITQGSDKCPIRIVSMPHGVTKATLSANEVDYLIEN